MGSTEHYRLGSKLLTLGARTLAQYPLLEMAGPYLRALASALGETVAFSRYDNGDVVYVDCVDSPHAISITLHVGGRAPACRQLLLDELEAIRERGFAVDDGHVRAGVRAAAAPVLDALGRPAGAITAVGLAADMSMERVHAIGPEVTRTAAALSHALGWPLEQATSS